MSDTITWVMEAAVSEGTRADLTALMQEMVAHVRATEPGCVLYDWFISPDGTTCHILESYADDAALLTHVVGFNARYAGWLFGLIRPQRMTVYGAPSAEARAAIAPLRPVYMERL
ncbi:putative quinol monooxygenase [Chachezhania sediminis]|uniref:putative quinol monooxygenase n=1 Tax=Chachezhania sediminis TaxID=2599291 RepID=UPI00131AFC2C|nr:antibiotic biosynthesis monooxygenase [Chachezhania sediminis]